MDIIEQLEEGKRALENGDVNINDLRTHIESSESVSEEIVKQPKKKKSKPVEEQPVQQSSGFDLFAQAEQLIKEQTDPVEQKELQSEQIKPTKVLQDPDFNFNDFYEKDQTIYFIRYFEKLGSKELLTLKIRSIYPRFMVACEDKQATVCMGPDVKDFIFLDKRLAKEVFEGIKVRQVNYTSDLDSSKKPVEIEDEEESEDYLGNELETILAED